MKKILKLSSLAFLLIATVACENDDQKIVQAKGGPELISPLSDATYLLKPENATDEATTLVWNHADYSQQTEVNYNVEVALAGTDFATIVSGGTTTNRFVTWTVEALNTVALDAGLDPYVQGDLDVRIKASLGSNADIVSYSNVITLKITPYTTDLPQLAVPGNHQGWSPPTAPRIAASAFGKTDYEGYVSLDGEFKFVGPDASGVYDWNAGPDYGDDGTFSGVLVETGEVNINVSAGYYRVKANTGAVSATNPDGLTWSTTLVSWGIIGSATPTGWDSDTDMTYNATTKKWSIIIPLTAGEIKFRYNDTWNAGDAQFNLGLFDASKTGQNYGGETMSYGGGNIPVANAGNYLVELDLSNPRAYTYTLTAQ